MPTKAHHDDAGLDCYAKSSIRLPAGCTVKMPLGFGIDLQPGYVGLLLPRSSMNARCLVERTGVIDAGYKGEICAIICNMTNDYADIDAGDKVAQLAIMPVMSIDAEIEHEEERKDKGFGSSGK